MVETCQQPRLIPKHLTASEALNCESSVNRERKIAERRFAEVRQLANKFIALDNEIRGLPGSTQVRMQMVADSLQYLSSLSRDDAPVDQDLALEIA